MGSGTAKGHSVTVDTAYVQNRLARIGALMAAVIGFISVVELGLVGDALAELRKPSYWLIVSSGLCWATLWLLCKLVPMRAGTLRIVEAACIGGAVTTLAVVPRLGAVNAFINYDGPAVGNEIALSFMLVYEQQVASISVVVAMALALTARAALVPTSPRHTVALTAGLGIPLVFVWVIDVSIFAIPDPGLPEHYATSGADLGVIPVIVAIWWAITTAVCFVISRVVHGLQVEVLAARKLGQYTLEEKLGEGGMGEVYRARHSRLRRPTAIKLLPAARSSEVAVTRFEAEVQLTAELTHPNTITIFDYGRTDEGVFYYAMEHLAGVTLEEVVAVDGAQPAARVIKILEQAAGALQEAHAAGLIHRDIKPANIMLAHQGNDPDAVKVLDFGLVRPIEPTDDVGLTLEGSLVGTPQYLAPETISAANSAGPRSDLYSLGAVGYFLLTGTHVFSGANLVEMCAHHLHTAVEPVASRLGRPVAEDLAAMLMQCLAKRPEDRPDGAAALIVRLRQCKDHGGWTPEDAESWWERIQGPLAESRSGNDPVPVADATDTINVAAP